MAEPEEEGLAGNTWRGAARKLDVTIQNHPNIDCMVVEV